MCFFCLLKPILTLKCSSDYVVVTHIVIFMCRAGAAVTMQKIFFPISCKTVSNFVFLVPKPLRNYLFQYQNFIHLFTNILKLPGLNNFKFKFAEGETKSYSEHPGHFIETFSP